MSTDPKYDQHSFENKKYKEECGICCSKKSSFLECSYCKVKSCFNCNEKYLLTVNNPRCMNCNKEWSYNWLRTNFPKNWINKTYRMYKEDQLFEFEKSLLPEVMDEVAFEEKYLQELTLLSKLKFGIGKLADELRKSRFEEDYKIFNIFKANDNLSIFNFCFLFKGNNPDLSYLEAWEKWEKEKDKDMDQYQDLRTLPNVLNITLNLNRRENMIYKILQSKIDFSLVKQAFGEGFKVLKPEYNPENNTINSTLFFHFSEKRDKKIRGYLKHIFQVKIPKNTNIEEGAEAFYIISIYPEKDSNDEKAEYKLKLQYNDLKMEIKNETLWNFFRPTLKDKTSSNFSRPCPKEDCRGFFRNDFICGLCNLKVCKHCLEEEKEEHKCNPDILKSVKMMEKDSKPCPKCNCIIFKISGCQQIWCTQCKTAFDWGTLQIETGRIHNPHYWEYLRKIGKDEDEMKRVFGDGDERRNEGEEECFTFEHLERYIGGSRFGNIFNKIYHLQEVDLPRFRVENLDERNKDLRKLYLRQKITEKEMRSKITSRFKRNNYNVEMTQILEMFIQTVKDLFVTHFLNNGVKQTRFSTLKYFNVDSLYSSLINLQKYLIEEVEKICKVYDYVTPYKHLNCLHESYFDFLNWSRETMLTKFQLIEQDIRYYQNTIDCLTSGNDYFNDFQFQPRIRLMNRRYWRNDESFENYKQDKVEEYLLEISYLQKVKESLINQE